MESEIEKITEMEREIVEQSTDKEIETGEQSRDSVEEIEDRNPGETVRDEASVREHQDSPCPMVIEDDTSLGSVEVSTLLEGTNDEDPPKIDDERTHDEKNFQSEISPHQTHSPSLALNAEDGLINPSVEDTVEQNTKSSEVSMDILLNDKDSVIISEETAVVHGETITIPGTKVTEDKGSPRHHTNIVMEQEIAAEEQDMISSGDHGEIPVNPDTKLSEVKGSPQHHANTVMEQDKAAEEHGMLSSEDHDKFPENHDTKLSEVKGSLHHHANIVMELEKTAEKHETISSGDHEEFSANPDTKVFEEIDDRMNEDEASNINLAPVNHDQETTTELDKEPEVPCSDIVLNLEDLSSEPLIGTSMTVEKEPDIPATEYLTDNDKSSDVLAVGVSGESDKGLSVLPATQTSSDRVEKITTTLEAEPKEDMKHDVPVSKLVVDATVDPTINKDVNVEANTEKIDNCRVPEVSDADNETAPGRLEPGPPCVASSNIKSETRVSGDLNNGVRNIVLSPPVYEGTTRANHSFLLDDTSEGNESGTEEDQSDFMKELYRFFKERNMEFKPPKFYGEGLNCLKLWRAVTRLGGYDKVTGSKLWRQVGESFRPPKTCTTVSWTFRGFYEKALLEYERHKVSGGELQITLPSEPEPMNIDNQASGSGRARRDSAARAMQGWHSQRLNGNTEVSDSANKDKNLVVPPKREKQIGTNPGSLKRKRPMSTEHGAKNAIKVSRPMLDVTVVDVGPPADWVKINVRRTDDCFEVYALVPGLVREEVRVQSDPAGRLVISGEPENPMNPWGATPFKKVVSLPTRIDPHHTSAVVTLNGQLFVRVPIEQLD